MKHKKFHEMGGSMARKCGDCLFFNGAGKKCVSGNISRTVFANNNSCTQGFKGKAMANIVVWINRSFLASSWEIEE